MLHAWRSNAFFFYDPPNVGDAVTYSVASFPFGDGPYSYTNLEGTVISVDAPEDWFLASQSFTHTYAGYGPHLAGINSCCRIHDLENAPSGSYSAMTQVDLSSGNGGSPVSSISPILQMVQGGSRSCPCPSPILMAIPLPAAWRPTSSPTSPPSPQPVALR